MRTTIPLCTFGRFLKLLPLLGAVATAQADYYYSTLSGAITLSSPNGIAVAPTGDAYVSESSTNSIRKISSSGVWTTFAGLPGTPGSADAALGQNARFDFPQGLAADSSGNLFVADTGNNTIRRISSSGVVTTLAGTSGGGSGAGSGSVDGTGAAAAFNLPYGVAVDASGNVYVADTFNQTIRKITPAGVTTTIAGLAGASGSTNGVGSSARFSYPRGVAVDSSGNIYVADTANHTVRKIATNGTVSTLAGTAGEFGYVDGTGSAARFSFPHGVAVDSAGFIYVSDTSNNSIRRITPDGVVTTVGGTTTPGSSDGNGTATRFSGPDSLALNSLGDIYVADTGNNAIRKGLDLSRSQNVVADFNHDGFSDILWQNTVTGERFVWFMNGVNHVGGSSLGVISTDWSMAATADFNGDGNTDILWQNLSTGERFVWFMNGVGHVGGASLGVVDINWSIVGAGDFDGDGNTDILWQNLSTGERYIWFMSGAGHLGSASLGTVSTSWSIAGVADFTGDGQLDILWQNLSTAERYFWYMNGATNVGGGLLGMVDTQWSIAAIADFNGDRRKDILWQNTTTGERYVWFMNGTGHVSDASLGIVGTEWSIVR